MPLTTSSSSSSSSSNSTSPNSLSTTVTSTDSDNGNGHSSPSSSFSSISSSTSSTFSSFSQDSNSHSKGKDSETKNNNPFRIYLNDTDNDITFTPEEKPQNGGLTTEESLSQKRAGFLMFLLMIGFLFANVSTNSFSSEGTFGSYFKKIGTIIWCVLFGAGTFFSNFVSKTTALIDPADALLKCCPSDLGRLYARVREELRLSKEVRGTKEAVIILTSAEIDKFELRGDDSNGRKLFQLLANQFKDDKNKDDKNKFKIVVKSKFKEEDVQNSKCRTLIATNTAPFFQDFSVKKEEKVSILNTVSVPSKENIDAAKKIENLYAEDKLALFNYDSYLQGANKKEKALYAFTTPLRYILVKGLPGLVLFNQVLVPTDWLLAQIIPGMDSWSWVGRLILKTGVVTWLGTSRVVTNNILKADNKVYHELRVVGHNLQQLCCSKRKETKETDERKGTINESLRLQIPKYKALGYGLFGLGSILLTVWYNGATSYFYSPAASLDTICKELAGIPNSENFLSLVDSQGGKIRVLGYLQTGSNVLLAVFTSCKSTYDWLKGVFYPRNGGEPKNGFCQMSGGEKAFTISTVMDSIQFGINAGFNSYKTIPNLELAIFSGAGIFVTNTTWAFDTKKMNIARVIVQKPCCNKTINTIDEDVNDTSSVSSNDSMGRDIITEAEIRGESYQHLSTQITHNNTGYDSIEDSQVFTSSSSSSSTSALIAASASGNTIATASSNSSSSSTEESDSDSSSLTASLLSDSSTLSLHH